MFEYNNQKIKLLWLSILTISFLSITISIYTLFLTRSKLLRIPKCTINGYQNNCYNNTYCVIVPRVNVPICDDSVVMSIDNNMTVSNLNYGDCRMLLLFYMKFYEKNNTECWVWDNCSSSTFIAPFYTRMNDILFALIIFISLIMYMFCGIISGLWFRFIKQQILIYKSDHDNILIKSKSLSFSNIIKPHEIILDEFDLNLQ